MLQTRGKMLKVLIFILGVFPAQALKAQFYTQGNFVTDLSQGIIWLRCSLGQRWDPTTKQCSGDAKRLNFEEIDQAISQANEQLGGTWRLPTLEELEHIVCQECGPPKIDSSSFPNTQSEPYWTSDVNWISSRNRWSVNFMTGLKYGRFFPQKNQLAVRLVSDK